MSQILSFRANKIRTIVENDRPWFVAKDVCATLGISWGSATLKPVPDDWKGVMNFITPSSGQRGGGKQRLSVISEQGLYMFAFRSNKEEAVALTRWVAGEVLPAIRKNGRYETKPQPALPESNVTLPAASFEHLARREFEAMRQSLYAAGDSARKLSACVESLRMGLIATRRKRTDNLNVFPVAEQLGMSTENAFRALHDIAETIERNARTTLELAKL